MRGLKSLLPILIAAVLASCSKTPVPDEQAETPQTTPGESATLADADSEEAESSYSEPAADEASVVVQTSGIAEPPANQRISPRDWAGLHRVALQPESEIWADAIRALRIVGDGFTVDHLRRIKTERLSEDDRELLSACLEDIQERVSAEDESTAAEMVLPRLERAAYCDLTCNPLETVLVQWTLAKLRSQAHLPQVRARLEQLCTSYKPEVASDAATDESEQMFGTMSERVPLYVIRVLDRSIQ